MTIEQIYGRNSKQIIDMRRWLHMHPEESLQEYKTAAYIEQQLDAMGIEHRRVAETGVYAVLRGRQPGPITVLRADIDALRVPDEKQVDYRSKHEGFSHSCGHDMHTASLLGAAMALKAQPDLKGEIRLFFQQGEEVGGGAKHFIQAGLMEGVERVLGLHADSAMRLGQVGIKPGANNASCDAFTIRVQGVSAHVSTPHLGADALYTASLMVTALQGLATRLTDPVEPVIIGVGKMSAGSAYNAVADTAVLEGTTRFVNEETRVRINERIDSLAHALAAQYGCQAEVTFTDYAPALFNDPDVCAELMSLYEGLPGVELVTDRPLRLGADDYAEFLNLAPGAYIYVGTYGRPGTNVPHHNGHFDVDEEALLLGSQLLTRYALSQHQA